VCANTFSPSQQDLSVDVSVQPEIGATDLLRKCMVAIDPEWSIWSFGLDLPEEMTHIECKGFPVKDEKECLLHHFAKKPRGRTETTGRRFDFSVILDIHLVIKGSFYELVNEHREQALQAGEGGANKVCKILTQCLYRCSSHYRGNRFQRGPVISLMSSH
jgi:hypothetical protein